MTRATAEAQAAHRSGERVYTVTRAGPPGIQRYAQTWSGDNTTSWHMLRWNIAHGPDDEPVRHVQSPATTSGGFSGPVPEPELLVRWVQNGAFSPRFIMNSWKAGGEDEHAVAAPGSATGDSRGHVSIIARFRTCTRCSGAPPLRASQRCGRCSTNFERRSARVCGPPTTSCSGPYLLVAGVVEPGQRERSVYLPRGVEGWYDFHTGGYHPAGSEVVADAPLDRIPAVRCRQAR